MKHSAILISALFAATAFAVPPKADNEGFRVPFGSDVVDFGYPQLDFQNGRERVKPNSVAVL